VASGVGNLANRDKPAVTMADIARLANVSKPTVSRALSNSPLVNAATRSHVLAVANQHGYTVNRNAQKLRHKRTNTVAVSMDFDSHRQRHISDPFMYDLLAGVSEALGDRSQDLLLCAPNHNDSIAFQQILKRVGFDIKLTPFLQRRDGSAKGDWDVGIALDMLEYAIRVDTIVLASGDGDFTAVVDKIIQEHKISVEVYGVPDLTASSLIHAATRFEPIQGNLLLPIPQT